MNTDIECQVCGKHGAIFTGFTAEWGMDERDTENTPENLPYGKAWVCLTCLDKLPYVPAADDNKIFDRKENFND